MFSLHYACDNMGLCVRSRHDADNGLATDCNRNEGGQPITTRKLIRLHAEHIRQQLGRNNFFRLTADYQASCLDNGNIISVLNSMVQIMDNHYYSKSQLFVELIKQLHNLQLVTDIKIGRGFIEQQHLRAGEQRAGDRHISR